MKEPIQSREISKMIEDMKCRLSDRQEQREDTAHMCSVFGFILVLILLLALTGCSSVSPAVGESGPGAGLLFSERELRRHPELR